MMLETNQSITTLNAKTLTKSQQPPTQIPCLRALCFGERDDPKSKSSCLPLNASPSPLTHPAPTTPPLPPPPRALSPLMCGTDVDLRSHTHRRQPGPHSQEHPGNHVHRLRLLLLRLFLLRRLGFLQPAAHRQDATSDAEAIFGRCGRM